MPGDKKEPQSYGSEADWVSGRTGQKVNDNKSAPTPEHRDFYDARRESETSDRHQGGEISPEQHAENLEAAADAPPVRKPAGAGSKTGGAKRGGFFKKRDYEG